VEPFKYAGEFPACRASLDNYLLALETHYGCAESKLRAAFDSLLVSVPRQLECYEAYFEQHREGDPTALCPLLEVPRIHGVYDVEGLDFNLGVPPCVRTWDEHNFAPTRARELEQCREGVAVFLGRVGAGWTPHAVSARSQYDEYLRNLRWRIDQNADAAVRKFNCLARGESYCF